MKPISRHTIRLSLLLAGLSAAGGTAQAASWDAGDWKLSLGGNINQFYVRSSCGDAGDSGGTTLSGLVCAATDDKSSIQNGLLPASLNVSAATTQNDWDISANVNVYYGTVSSASAGGADALAFSTVDARQVYMTFGKAEVGTFKLGRDFGLFGFDPIIADMSLLGVGAGFSAAEPGHTTLGGLGYGYVYVDRLSQMNYTTPDFGGVTVTVGLFQPFSGNGAAAGDDAGMHGKVSYSWKGGVAGTVSASFLRQEVNNQAGGTSDIQGFDLFGKLTIEQLVLAAYYGDATGMTSLAIGGLVLPGFDAAGNEEETSWTMLQATYQVTPMFRAGINLSSSEQTKLTDVENTKTTLGAFYNLTPSLTLVGEFSNQESKLTTGTDKSSNINLGAILFF